MEDSITLKRSEQRRVQVLMQLAGGVISSGQAAELLSLSERQVRRLAAVLGSDGPAGLIHGNRGVCGLVLHQLETGHRVGSQKPDFQRVS
jgi:hypothetical protein